MSSPARATYEAGPLPGDRQAPYRFRTGLLSRVRARYSPETLLIPVVFASRLGKVLPSTTLMELGRQTVCRLSNSWRGHPAAFVAAIGVNPQVCDTPEVMRDFATLTAILTGIGGLTALLGCGVLNRVSPYYGRKPIFLFIFITEIVWNCLVLGSQFMPDGLADWALLLGMLFNTFAEYLPYNYLINLCVVDICLPEQRTTMMNSVGGWGVLGVSIPLALGGFITTGTGNPLIVFYIATVTFVATFLYVVFVLPETLPQEKRNMSSRDHDSSARRAGILDSFVSIFEPLKMLIPTRTQTCNWQLIWCAAHIFAYATGHGYIWSAWFVIVTSKYHLTPADTGIYWACVTFVGTITMTVIVPQVVRFLRPYYMRGTVDYPLADVDLDIGDELHLGPSNHLEVHMAMAGTLLSSVATIFAALSSTMLALLICGVFVGFTYVHGSTVRSLAAGCVDPLKQDGALAAFEMVDSAGRVLSPIIMGAIFTATVDSAPLFVFFMQLVLLLVSAGLLWFVRDADGYHKLSTV